MMRSICSATLSFGLISIPVKAYITASAEKFSFNWISPNGNRVKQKLVDEETEEELERSIVQSGYEVEKNKYVIFTKDELDVVSGEKTDIIEIQEVTSGVKICPTVVERALYLAPDKSDKTYRLLHHCLRVTNKVAVCKWYAKGKDHLVVVAPKEDLLIMFQLYYQSELRELGVNFAKGSEPTKEEVRLGKLLLDQLATEKFDPSTYRDEYSERVRAAITLKQEGKIITSAKQISKYISNDYDIAALLEKSIKK